MKISNYVFRTILAIIVLLSSIMIFSIQSYANHPLNDAGNNLAVISRAISFMQNGPKGVVDMAIVYDPDDKESLIHAELIENLLINNKGEGKIRLIGKKVPIRYLNADDKYKVIFVSKGVVRKHKRLLELAHERGIVTVSTDIDCLDRGGCLLNVSTSPSVEIAMNNDVANKTGIRFESAFRMMIVRR